VLTFRAPPPKGKKAKSVACSSGYKPVIFSGRNPFQPWTFGLLKGLAHRSGLYLNGSSHKSADLTQRHAAAAETSQRHINQKQHAAAAA
jgi:hypothetical protein